MKALIFVEKKDGSPVGAKNAAQIEGPEKADASVTAAFLAAGIKKIEGPSESWSARVSPQESAPAL